MEFGGVCSYNYQDKPFFVIESRRQMNKQLSQWNRINTNVSPTMAGLLGVIAPFIYPVIMGGMMIMMFRGNKHSCCEEKKVEVNNEIMKKD
jgi:hypothetical protein